MADAELRFIDSMEVCGCRGNSCSWLRRRWPAWRSRYGSSAID